MAKTNKTAKTVLLVDDDVDFLDANRMALEAAGFRVLLAHDGREGFSVASKNAVDVAVLDVMMTTPDEGFELARKLRSEQRTRKIPLIMLTAVNEDMRSRKLPTFSNRDRDDAWLPVDQFVEKPVAPRKLVTLVQELATIVEELTA